MIWNGIYFLLWTKVYYLGTILINLTITGKDLTLLHNWHYLN